MEGQSLPSSSAWTAPQSICPQYTKSGPQPHKPAKWGIPGLACPAPSSRVQAQALGPHLTLGSCLLLSVSPITPPWYLPSFLIVDYNVLSTFFGKKKKVGGGVGRRKSKFPGIVLLLLFLLLGAKLFATPSCSGWQEAWVLPPLSFPSFQSLSFQLLTSSLQRKTTT